jgi:hypothetical protein
VIGGTTATRFDFTWTRGFTALIPIERTAYVLANDEPQHWIVADTTDGQLLINWTIEDAAGADLESQAETLIAAVLGSLQF